jgi:hypothetical protein
MSTPPDQRPTSSRRPISWRRSIVWLLGGLLLVAGAGLVAIQIVYAPRVYRALPGPKLPPQDPLPPLGLISATQCATCHPQIAAEWRESAHGRASTTALFHSEFRHEGQMFICGYCHQPLVEQRAQIVTGLRWVWPLQIANAKPNPRFRPELAQEGVTCLSCHGRGSAIAGPHALSTPAHAVVVEPDFGNPTLCATCHRLHIPLGRLLRPVQETIEEWQAYRAAGGDKQCIDCHMPDVGQRPLVALGPPRRSRSHALRGPGDVEFLRTGAVVQRAALHADDGGARGELVLYNGTGHRLPTAEPRHYLQVTLSVLSAGGQVLAQTSQRIERRMDPVALTESPGGDSTLLPRETRRIELRLAGLPAGGARLRLSLHYFLWAPEDPIARDAGHDEASLRRTIYESERPLPP